MRQPRPRAVLCDVSGLPATLAAVDQLARMQLAARRSGCQVQLRNTARELEGLIALAGLADVLPVEVERQAEDGEQRGGVEEERQLGDPPV